MSEPTIGCTKCHRENRLKCNFVISFYQDTQRSNAVEMDAAKSRAALFAHQEVNDTRDIDHPISHVVSNMEFAAVSASKQVSSSSEKPTKEKDELKPYQIQDRDYKLYSNLDDDSNIAGVSKSKALDSDYYTVSESRNIDMNSNIPSSESKLLRNTVYSTITTTTVTTTKTEGESSTNQSRDVSLSATRASFTSESASREPVQLKKHVKVQNAYPSSQDDSREIMEQVKLKKYVKGSSDSAKNQDGSDSSIVIGSGELDDLEVDDTDYLPPAPTSHVVVFAYSPKRRDEMQLTVGDLIGIQKEYSDGWALVQNISEGRKQCVIPLAVLVPISSGPTQKVHNGSITRVRKSYGESDRKPIPGRTSSILRSQQSNESI
jgi:hypothetical protein